MLYFIIAVMIFAILSCFCEIYVLKKSVKADLNIVMTNARTGIDTNYHLFSRRNIELSDKSRVLSQRLDVLDSRLPAEDQT